MSGRACGHRPRRLGRLLRPLAALALQPARLGRAAEQDRRVRRRPLVDLADLGRGVRPPPVEQVPHHLPLADLAVEQPVAAARIAGGDVEVVVRRVAVAEVQPHRRQSEFDGQPVAVDATAVRPEPLGDRRRLAGQARCPSGCGRTASRSGTTRVAGSRWPTTSSSSRRCSSALPRWHHHACGSAARRRRATGSPALGSVRWVRPPARNAMCSADSSRRSAGR